MRIRWSIARILCAVGSLAAHSPAHGQCIDYGDYYHWVSRLELGGAAGMAAAGSYVYVAGWGLHVIDVADPGNPRIVTRLDTPGIVTRNVVVVGSLAYVTAGSAGLLEIDVADPEALAIVGNVDTPGQASDIVVVGDFAYVADGLSGLQVIDIADPENPRIIGSADTPDFAREIAVSGAVACVADDSDLQILDVSNPYEPRIVGHIAVPGQALSVDAVGTYAYVVGGGLQVVDVSDPADPQLIGSVMTPSSPNYVSNVAVFGDRAYVGDGYFGLQMIDISDPANPAIIDQVSMDNFPASILVSDPYVFVTDHAGPDPHSGRPPGLNVVSIGNSQPPPLLGDVSTPSQAGDVAVSGAHVFVTDYSDGLIAVDIADPQSPIGVGSVRGLPWEHPWDVEIAGSYAYVAAVYALQIIDIADATALRILGTIDSLEAARNVAIWDRHAYVADGSRGLLVVDVADPDDPRIVGTVDTPGDAYGIAVVAPYAFVADGASGLQVIDITAPQSPRIVGSVDIPDLPWRVAVSGTHAFVLGGYPDDLQVVDISNPANPWVVHSMELPGEGYTMTISGTLAYVASRSGGVHVLDIGNPVAPRLIGSSVGNYAYGVAVSGAEVYVAAGEDGLRVFPSQCLSATPVALLSFTAIGGAAGVRLRWETAGESDHAGFHVYRRTTGVEWSRLTGPLLTGGPTYVYTDRGALGGFRHQYELESVSRTGDTERFGPVEIDVPLTTGLALSTAPNPSTGATTITYTLPEAGPVTLRVFDLSGRVVGTLLDRVETAGPHETTWNATDAKGNHVPAGIYFLKLEAGTEARTQRVTIAR